MWKPSAINYKYRDLYSFTNPVNKVLQWKFTRNILQKNIDLSEQKVLEKIKINLQILEHYMTIHDRHLLHQYVIFLLKSICYNLRYSKLYPLVTKSNMRDYVYYY